MKDDSTHDVARTAVNLVALQLVWTNASFEEVQRADRDQELVIHKVENQRMPLPKEASGWLQVAHRYLLLIGIGLS